MHDVIAYAAVRADALMATLIGTLNGVSVTNQRLTCPGPLIEERPGVGACARGEQCEALGIADDYLAYRGAHMRVTTTWLDKAAED